MTIIRFRDREDAGKQLAAKLKTYKKHPAVMVMGLPRGGVVVANEIAEVLDVPLEVFLVRKLGVPWQPELAMGALAEGDVSILNQSIVTALDIPESEIRRVIKEENKELHRRQRLYRGQHASPVVKGREIILVDDGLATGATMRAAVKALKKNGAKKIVVAVPVGDAETCEALHREVDDLICLSIPHPLRSIGQWYDEFEQTSDETVVDLLAKSHNKFLLDGYVESEVVRGEE